MSNSKTWWIVGLLCFAILLVGSLSIGLYVWLYTSQQQGTAQVSVLPSVGGMLSSTTSSNNGTSIESTPKSTTAKKSLPPLPEAKTLQSTNIQYYDVTLDRAAGKPMRLYIYMPSGDRAGKLPCMLEAPAGTPLLHGASIGTAEESASYLPFVAEGMITISYSIDGAMPEGISPDSESAFLKAISPAFKAFTDADAGVENGKAAIDYVVARLPQADPDRLYTWGHSSAATLALLLAAKEPRIKKCIAMAPITDLTLRLGDIRREPKLLNALPGFSNYLKSGSPISYVQGWTSPVFLSHAKDDDNAPYRESAIFVSKLKGAGGNIEFLSLPSGGHYQEMVSLSMPKAVEWLKSR